MTVDTVAPEPTLVAAVALRGGPMIRNLLLTTALLISGVNSASADLITLTVTGTVSPWQFNSRYFIAPVIDQQGLFGIAGADLSGDPFTVLWTFNNDADHQ